MWTSPLYFAIGGVFDGSLVGVGFDGYFWSPVPNGSDLAGYAYFNVDGIVYPSDYGYRGGGNLVRCILRPVVSSDSEGGDSDGGGGGK